MRLHRGRALLGVGDGIVSVDGLVVSAHSGKVCPLNNIRFIYQHGTQLETRLTDAPELPPVVLSPIGAHVLRAGGGTWASLYNDGLRVNGVHWHDPERQMPGLWDVDGDGRVLMCPDYNSGPTAGQGIQFRNPDSRTLVLDVPPHVTGPIRSDATMGPCVRSLPGLRAAWVTGVEVRTIGIAGFVPRPSWEPINFVVPIDVDGDVWLLERSDRLTLRPANALLGFVVTEGEAWGPDAVALSSEVVRVAWSRTAGEGPDAGVVIDQGLEGELVDLSVQPLPPVTAVTRPNRPFAFAAYSFGGATAVHADIALPIRQSAETVHALERNGHAIIETIDGPPATGAPYAVYAGEDGATSCEAAIDLARRHAEERGVGVLAYQEGRNMRASALAKLKKGDAAAPQLFLGLEESVAAFLAYARAECARVTSLLPPDVQLMPVVGWHTRKSHEYPNGLSDRALIEAWIGLTALADEQQWFGLIGFREGLSDFCAALVPYLDEFDSGVLFEALPEPDEPVDPVDPVDPTDPIDPPDFEEPQMLRSLVHVNGQYVEAYEDTHPDGAPLRSVRRVSDDAYLRVNTEGGMDWKPADQGAGYDEGHIPCPGAYACLRGAKNFLVTKAGPWTV